ncbi:MAG: hypothetical protein MZV63_58540, partial [Marinilabiliales bacterium]|nr:hypothetical protein [Marinilabiliales bacterium]
AVHVPHAPGARGAVDREAAGVAFVLDAGERWTEQARRRCPAAGRLMNTSLVMVWPLTVLLTSISGPLPDDRDLLLDGRLVQGDVQGDGGGQPDDDVLADEGLEALQGEDDLVGAGRQGVNRRGRCRPRPSRRSPAPTIFGLVASTETPGSGAPVAFEDLALHFGGFGGPLGEGGPGDEQHEDRDQVRFTS